MDGKRVLGRLFGGRWRPCRRGCLRGELPLRRMRSRGFVVIFGAGQLGRYESSQPSFAAFGWRAHGMVFCRRPMCPRTRGRSSRAAACNDGGFRLVDLAPWPSEDGSAPHQESDGYATALSTFVLQQLDEARFAAAITRGVMWLQRSQQADGRWQTLSPNKDRSEEEAFTRLLASDAATGFAVLVLSALGNPGVPFLQLTLLRIARRIPTWAVASNSRGEPSASSRGKERSSQHGGEDSAR